MTNLLNTVLVTILMMNLFALGTSRIHAVTRIVASQGVLLGFIPLLVNKHLSVAVVLMAIAAVVIKAVVIPSIIVRALRDAQIKHEVRPLIGFLPSIILGAIATAFALLFAGQLPLAGGHYYTLLVPTVMVTVLEVAGLPEMHDAFEVMTQVMASPVVGWYE